MNFKRSQVAFIVSFLALVSLCAAKLTRLPANALAVKGDTVTIQCFTENKDYPPFWSHIKVGSTQPNDVYLTVRPAGQDTIAGRMTEDYYGRFKVNEDRTTGDYSLQVTDVQPEDAGRYTCTARGGLGQQASAELGVIDPYPRCASNATDVIGENICNHEPDHIELSCSFRYKGNLRQTVNWIKTDRPDQVVRIAEAQSADDSGEAVSKFVLKADADDLHNSSFMCIVSSPSVSKDSKLRCTTPVINVLKITNLTEPRRVDHEEEVQCIGVPHLQETGCKWVRRKLEGDSGSRELPDTVVAEGRLLNLYRPEFRSGGTYVCIVECNIRGQPCPVEAMTIIYEPAELTHGASMASQSTLTLVIIPIVIVVVVVGIVIAVILYRKLSSKKSKRSEDDRSTWDNDNQRSAPSHERRPVDRTESIPLAGSKYEVQSDIALDITDSTRLLENKGDRAFKNKLAEEKALARMRLNAAMRKASDNSTDDADVAEGIRGSDERSKDE